MVAAARPSLERFKTLSGTLIDEIGARGAHDPVHSTLWPTVGAVAGHVTAIYTWVTTILRTGMPAERSEAALDDATMVVELGDARAALLDELRREDRECWIIGGATGSSTFWRCRMVLESLKHLLDVRTAPGERFAVPAELDTELAVAGVDEFLEVFLARGRPGLSPLPAPVRLVATDADRSWHLADDWTITSDDTADGKASATVEAPVAALLLLLWERASALEEPERFHVSGDREVVRALEAAPIHR